jgi:hypothetical protein
MSDFSHLDFLAHDDSKKADGGGDAFFGLEVDDKRSKLDKQAEVVLYLQKLTSDQSATNVDIQKELGIFLDGKDAEVLSMLRYNKAVEVIAPSYDGGEVLYRYHAKYKVGNRYELLALIERSYAGILQSDIKACYPAVEDDIKDMIVGGDVLACHNKGNEGGNDVALFSRGHPFFVELSGEVTAQPGCDFLTTSHDITSEVRRGDALCLDYGSTGAKWFRIDCAIHAGTTRQPERGTPPLTVSSIRERALKQKTFAKVFNDCTIPLDADYTSSGPSTGGAIKHGCTNDIRALWESTVEKTEGYKHIRADHALTEELISLNLITRPGTSASSSQGHKRVTKQKRPTVRAKRKTGKVSNTHLDGTALGDLFNKLRAEENSKR